MRRVRNRETCFHLTASQTVSLSSNKKIKLVEIFGTRNTWKHCIYCQEKCKSLNHSLSWHTSVGWAHNTNYSAPGGVGTRQLCHNTQLSVLKGPGVWVGQRVAQELRRIRSESPEIEQVCQKN